MIKLRINSDVDQHAALQLIESDRRYFEMAARVESLSVGQMAWMPELTKLAASCVVHRVNLDEISSNVARWVDEVESALKERGVTLARIYLDDYQECVDRVLRDRGYECRTEIGFLADKKTPVVPKHLSLSPVATEQDWQRKQQLHEMAMEGPDGYRNEADLWVRMELRKCQTLQMQSYLVWMDHQVVATVGAIVHDHFLRLKNILVSPAFRRCGIGLATVHLLWSRAEAEHCCQFGVFGVEGARGSRMYRRAGLSPATRQYEWSRLITN